MNIRLLRRIQKHIAQDPEHFAMYDFQVDLNGMRATQEKLWNKSSIPKKSCGTAYCIAGLAIFLTTPKHEGCYYAWTDSKRVLKLNEDQAHRLFHLRHWPKQFKAKDFSLSLAKKAVNRIDHFIKTKGRE